MLGSIRRNVAALCVEKARAELSASEPSLSRPALTRASSFLPSQNGDYNKPIPAQYMEHLNHVVSSVPSPRDPAQPQQWVSSQVLLCRRCSHHQTTKIKQLAAFTPREEVSTHG
jgi:hypothetical protein